MTTTDTQSAEARGREQEGRQGSGLAERPGGQHVDRLQSDRGRTTISDAVVAKIAGVAAREVNGVNDMGRGASRAFGGLRERLPGSAGSTNFSQGVSVEVGERQAAVDIDIVVEYGAAIPDVADGVRDNITRRVEGMTGLEVVEVNIAVDDVALGDELDGDDAESHRVQ